MLLLKLRVEIKTENEENNQNKHITHNIYELRDNADLLKTEITEEELHIVKNNNITIPFLEKARIVNDAKQSTNGTMDVGNK